MELAGFNVNHGFTEAVIRGLRSGLLGPEDYRRVSQADTLEDMRSALEETDYGTFLQDEPSPLLVRTVTTKCFAKLADEFKYVKAQSVEPLTTFMDFIAREKMIDNVCTIIQAGINKRGLDFISEKLHPLGIFEGITLLTSESFAAQDDFEDVYKILLQDTPVGPYFEEYLLSAGREKDEMKRPGIEANQVGGIVSNQDLEILKATVKTAWMQDFYAFVQTQGGTTAEVMGHILKSQADFHVLLVTLNALNTELSGESKVHLRNAMYPSFGYLYPEGQKELRKAFNDVSVRTALEPFQKYLNLYDEVKGFYEADSNDRTGKSMEDLIYKENVHMYEESFEQQYHFGVFYSWVRLREQEIRNIKWIANMISLNTKEHVDDIVPIFQPRM